MEQEPLRCDQCGDFAYEVPTKTIYHKYQCLTSSRHVMWRERVPVVDRPRAVIVQPQRLSRRQRGRQRQRV